MIAHIGDQLVLAGTRSGDPRRVGVITAVRHDDGTPPYQVRWLDTGSTSFIFPGAEAHVDPHPDDKAARGRR